MALSDTERDLAKKTLRMQYYILQRRQEDAVAVSAELTPLLVQEQIFLPQFIERLKSEDHREETDALAAEVLQEEEATSTDLP